MLLDYVRTLLALKMDKRAVTAMEYGLIAAMVAVVIIVALSSIGTNLKTTFNSVANEL
jgi:pilus assembly protein Flp/PilA